MIMRAAAFAKQAHGKQMRNDGITPYIHHPARVAARVMMLSGASEEDAAAAWLHDVLEDTAAKPFDIEHSFSPAVLKTVLGLTNVSKGSLAPRAERKAMDRNWLSKQSVSVKRIKMCDRIDNLLDMNGASLDFKTLYAEESLLLVDAIGDADLDLKAELVGLAKSRINESNPKVSKESGTSTCTCGHEQALHQEGPSFSCAACHALSYTAPYPCSEFKPMACPECGQQDIRSRIEDSSFSYRDGEALVTLGSISPTRRCMKCDFQFLDWATEIAHCKAVSDYLVKEKLK